MNNSITIATVIIKSNEVFDNKSRLALLDKVVQASKRRTMIMALPGGFLEFKAFHEKELGKTEKHISELISVYDKKLIICFGIDANEGKDQLALAIGAEGVIAIGRKFHPAPKEKRLNQAPSAKEKEFGFERIFMKGGKKFFLAVCYDSFGIKHEELKNDGVSVILNHIHRFYPKGEGVSGDAYYARHGLAGASKTWKCPAFGSAVFINREIPVNWPSGVKWTKGRMSTQKWKYDDNPIEPSKIEFVEMKNESAEVRFFKI
jgi:hypothetical protein